jgi:hypothetical protein
MLKEIYLPHHTPAILINLPDSSPPTSTLSYSLHLLYFISKLPYLSLSLSLHLLSSLS